MDRIIPLPGDWHFSMHMLVTIFNRFYGCFLQPLAVELGYSRIQYNPSKCYEKSSSFVTLIKEEVERQISMIWLRLLPTRKMFDGIRLLSVEDLKKENKYKTAIILSTDLERYENELMSNNDDVMKVTLEFPKDA